ncbi:MAG: hypothetical protein V1849_03075 [Chloroflexota bacterium]
MKKWLYLVAVLVVVVGLVGCGKGGGSEDMVSGTGTVKFISLEGGFYGIVGDDGQNYDPLNLAKEFQQDGLRVRFEGRKKDVATIRMWGTPVEITRIEKLS